MTRRIAASAVLLCAFLGATVRAQAPPSGRLPICAMDRVVSIAPPVAPLLADSLSADVTRFSFIAYGDSRGVRDGEGIQQSHAHVIESMLETVKTLSKGPDAVRFVLQSGDAVSNGADGAAWNVSYAPVVDRLIREGGVSYFSTVGNHDVTASLVADAIERGPGLCHYFSANAELIPPVGAPHRLPGYPTYAFGFGKWFFLAFDSNIAEDDVQFSWVQSELEALDRQRYPNIVVFFHHPVYSSGPHGGARVERPTQFLRDAYMPLFRRHHVRLLLTGHDHLFEHFVERYVDSAGTHRIDEIVSGGGGAPTYKHTDEPDLRGYVASAEVKLSVEHLVRPAEHSAENPTHYVVVSIDGDAIDLRVVGVSSRRFAPYGRASIRLSDLAPAVRR